MERCQHQLPAAHLTTEQIFTEVRLTCLCGASSAFKRVFKEGLTQLLPPTETSHLSTQEKEPEFPAAPFLFQSFKTACTNNVNPN